MISRVCTLAAFGGVLLVPSAATATWSIVGVDPETGQVGIAVASCYSDVRIVAGLAPGYGAVAAQAYIDFGLSGRNAAVNALMAGMSPAEALAAATDPATDSQAQTRQYGIVALGFESESVGFTGSFADDWKGDKQAFGVAAQGNLLVGEIVIDDSLAAFDATGQQCPSALADQLMAALEAGSAVGGDARCPPLTAWSAYLAVANPTDAPDSPSIAFYVPDQSGGGGGMNPVTLLREQFDAWRAMNPLDDGGCGGTGTGTSSGSGGSGTGGGSTGGGDGTSGGGGSDGGDGSAGTGDGGDDSGSAGSDDASGCGCRTPVREPAAWMLGLALFAVHRRRS